MTARWHIVTEGDTLTLSRVWPPRFDLAVTAQFPEARRLRLAHQIRQDMWRLLQRLRGFRPAVQVTRGPNGLLVTAGGAVAHPVPQSVRDRLTDLLHDPAHRARWLQHAGRRR